jgi:hypothetical protein
VTPEPDPSPVEVETAIAKLKEYKLLGNKQILAELSSNKEELPDQCKEYINVPIYKKGDKM